MDPVRICAEAASRLLPPPGTPVVLGVSGGCDSLVLLDLLVRDGRWPLIVYHLDHGLRPDSPADAAWVEEWAHRQPGVTAVVVERAEVAALVDGQGLEAAGRQRRYAGLRQAADRFQAGAVCTAHHADDQAETVLAHILRGAGPVGLAGIAERRELAPGLPLVRPLLACTRNDLRRYAWSQHLHWREDASNTDCRYRRNWIRHQVLPVFEAGVPGFAQALAAQSLAGQSLLAERTGRLLRVWEQVWKPPRLLLDPVIPLTSADRLALWRMLLRQQEAPINRRWLHRLDDLALGQPGRRLEAGRMRLTRQSTALLVEPPPTPTDPAPVTLTGPGTWRLGQACLVMEYRTGPALLAQARSATRQEAWLAAPAITPPLVWRTLNPSDLWKALGAPGRRRLLRWLADHGVPARSARHMQVIADAHGVVWVPGFTIAERARITDGPAAWHLVFPAKD